MILYFQLIGYLITVNFYTTLKGTTMDFEQERKGYNAQIEAAKQMANEALASNLQLRTNVCILNQALQDELKQKQDAHAQIESLKAQLLVMTNKVLESESLKPLPTSDEPQAPDAA